MEQERELTQAQVPDEAVELLQEENRSLRHQLQQTRARLEGIQKLLGMEKAEIPKTETVPPAPTRVEHQGGQMQGEKRRDRTEGGKSGAIATQQLRKFIRRSMQ